MSKEAILPVEIAVGGGLFDMDGVLVKSTHGNERCSIRWPAKYNLAAQQIRQETCREETHAQEGIFSESKVDDAVR